MHIAVDFYGIYDISKLTGFSRRVTQIMLRPKSFISGQAVEDYEIADMFTNSATGEYIFHNIIAFASLMSELSPVDLAILGPGRRTCLGATADVSKTMTPGRWSWRASDLVVTLMS